MSRWPINGIIENPNDHHTIRGYGLQYTVHDNTLYSSHLKRTWDIKVSVEEELAAASPLLYFRLDNLLSLF